MKGFGQPAVESKPFSIENYKQRVTGALNRHVASLPNKAPNPHKPVPLSDENALIRRSAEPVADRKAKANHNPRTKDYYRDLGYIYSREDVFDGARNLDHDFLGFADAIAMMEGKPQEPIVAVQLTSKANMNARVRKIQASRLAQVWLSTGNAIEVIGWELVSGKYEATVIPVTWAKPASL